MKSALSSIVIPVTLVSIALSVAVYQYRRAERLELAVLQLEKGLMTARIQHSRGLDREEPFVTSIVVGDDEIREGSVETKRDLKVSALPPRPNKEAKWAVLEQPKYQRAHRIRHEAWVEDHYGQLFAQLRLKPSELERLKQLLLDRRLASRDVQAAARELGLNDGDMETIRRLDEQTKLDIEQEIRQALGEEDYSEFYAYERSGAQRAVITQLESRLNNNGIPLNDVQSEALYGIFRRSASMGQSGNQGWVLNQDSLSQAQAVLSPQQLVALRRIMDEQAAELALQQLQNELSANAMGHSLPPAEGG